MSDYIICRLTEKMVHKGRCKRCRYHMIAKFKDKIFHYCDRDGLLWISSVREETI